jgi:hypothetical protein
MLSISVSELFGTSLPGIEMTTQFQEHLNGKISRFAT